MNFSATIFIPLTITILSAIIFFKKYRLSPIKITPIYLSCSFLVEIIAVYAEYKFNNNICVYDIFIIIEYIFYAYIFYVSILDIIFKRLILVWSAVFFVSLFLYYLNIYKFTESNLVSLIISYVFIILYSCVYLYQLLLSDSIIKYYHIPLFWMSLAALFSISLFGFCEFINCVGIYIPYNIAFTIKVVGLYGFYLFLNIAFICQK